MELVIPETCVRAGWSPLLIQVPVYFWCVKLRPEEGSKMKIDFVNSFAWLHFLQNYTFDKHCNVASKCIRHTCSLGLNARSCTCYVITTFFIFHSCFTLLKYNMLCYLPATRLPWSHLLWSIYLCRVLTNSTCWIVSLATQSWELIFIIFSISVQY